MLVLTESAAKVVKSVTTTPQAPSGAGLRISSAVPEPESASSLEVEAVTAPAVNDEVLDAAGARVFVAPQAVAFLEDKVLDAQVDGQGNARFSLTIQKPDQM